MNRRSWAAWASIWVVWTTGSANAEAVSVKAPTLSEVRAALTRYDLTPAGTTAQLARLAAYAREHAGQAAGEEASFLHAAVAADLLFIADFTEDRALAGRTAETFGTTPEALRETLIARLEHAARGVYEQSARLALRGLTARAAPPAAAVPDANAKELPDVKPGPATGGAMSVARQPAEAPDTRSDALLLQGALRVQPGITIGSHLSAAGSDPCAAATSCPALYTGFDSRGRRALWYLQQLVAADQRLAQATREGDPLALALGPTLEPLRAQLGSLQLALWPRLPADVVPLLAQSTSDAKPQLDGVFLVQDMQVSYLPVTTVSSAQLQPGAAMPALPSPEHVVALHDLPSYVRAIDALVTTVRRLRGERPSWSAGVAVGNSTPAHVLARALVSVKKGGAQPFLLGRNADGDAFATALHVLLAGVDPPAPETQVKLRVRLGGYNLGTLDLPRVHDDSGYHFDVAGLQAALAKRAIQTAAVSFQGDVSAEQLGLALFQLRPSQGPIELLVQ